jgi:hypothetical protein
MILVFKTGVSSDPAQAGSIPVRLRYPSGLADLRSPVVVTAGGDRSSLVPRLWSRAQANSSPSNSGPMAMGAGR